MDTYPDLNEEFAGHLALCQRTIRYVAEAARRASKGIAVRVLLGGMDAALSQTLVAALQAVTQRGSVKAVQADDWARIMEDARTETSDLFTLAPQHIAARKEMTDPLRLGCEGLQQFASCSPAPVVVLLAKGQFAEWRQAYADAGADDVLGLPVHPNTLAEALKRCTRAHGGRPQSGKPGTKESGAAT